MSNKENIIVLFFEDKLSIIQIADKLNITKQYVSKIVRKDTRYVKEREERKAENKEKQKKRVKNYIYNKRRNERQERLNAIIEMQHIQASCELSRKNTINNRAYRDWNSSIYVYNNSTKEYQINEAYKNKTSYAIPKKIKWQ